MNSSKNLSRFIFATFTTAVLVTTICRYSIKIYHIPVELAVLALVFLNVASVAVFKKMFHDDFEVTLKNAYAVVSGITLITLFQIPVLLRSARLIQVRGEMLSFYIAFALIISVIVITILKKRSR